MSGRRGVCPICDRTDCENWLFVPGAPTENTVNVSSVDGRPLPENCRSQNAFDDCQRHAVDWRARCLSMAPVVQAAEEYLPLPFTKRNRIVLNEGPFDRLHRAVDAMREGRKT